MVNRRRTGNFRKLKHRSSVHMNLNTRSLQKENKQCECHCEPTNLPYRPSNDPADCTRVSTRRSCMLHKAKNILDTNKDIVKKVLNGIIVITVIGILIFGVRLLDNEKKRKNFVLPDAEDFQPPSWSKLKIYGGGAICSDGAYCAQIGKKIFEKNGSAVDVAIATMICNGLVNMQATGIGGGFMMTIYKRKSQKSYFLVARDTAPIASNSKMFSYSKDNDTSKRGPLSIAVPGEVAGYAEAHRKFGRLTWYELFQPNVELCRNGWNLTRAMYDDALEALDVIMRDWTLKKNFIDEKTGELKKPGSFIQLGKICETLRIIQENGAGEFYNGSLGRILIEDLQKQKSILTVDDLKRYRAVWKNPLETILSDDTRVITPNLPSSGVLLSLILNVFDEFKFTNESLAGFTNTTLTYHKIIETWKFAFAMRERMGDDEFVENMTEFVKNLTSKAFARSIKLLIDEEGTWNDPEHYGAECFCKEDRGTAEIAVLSPDGDAVSVTSSINMYFGSGIVSERTGILMNSGMDDFAIPSVTSHYGLPRTNKNNFIQPGKRAMSSMVPSILVSPTGDVKMVIGASGGPKILTSTSFTIARHLWMNNTIKQAIDAARIHHQLSPMEVSYEYGLPRPVLEGLQRLGHKINRYRDRGSVVCALTKNNDIIYANSDYRKNVDIQGINEINNFLIT